MISGIKGHFKNARRLVRNSIQSYERLEAIQAGIANQSDLINRKLQEVVLALANQQNLTNRKMDALIAVLQGRKLDVPVTPAIDFTPRHDPVQAAIIPSTTTLQPASAPVVDMTASANPVMDIMASSDFSAMVKYFNSRPSSKISLISPNAQALLYSLIRYQRPDHVVEIGCFKGGTTEALARALEQNGRGHVHAVGPYDKELFGPTYHTWPAELQSRVTFYEENSATFFESLKRRGIQPDFVFVDGNHDYEFALFDIACSAKVLSRRGFIAVDNISQAGPFHAVVDFLRENSDWEDCVGISDLKQSQVAYDRGRAPLPDIDFSIVRAPSGFTIRHRPITFGETGWHFPQVSGVRVVPEVPSFGILHVQCILRGFSSSSQVEIVASGKLRLNGQLGEVDLPFDRPAAASAHDHYRVETWLSWDGMGTLSLSKVPEVL